MDPKIVQDYVPSIESYLYDWHVRVTWIAFMTLWVFWGLAWFIRNAFGGDSGSTHIHTIQSNAQIAATNDASNLNNDPNHIVTDPETGGIATTANANAVHNKNVKYLAAPAWSVNVFNRLNRAHDMLRDLVIMLLSILTLNTFARASTRAVMVIAWIFVAFAVVYFVVEASYEHRYLRLVYSLTFYGLGLAVVGLAFAQGFYD
ncbi:hypothetical protein [Parasitella parasitica]|uniref:Uncharacterized protein n=1 Tax=Parasitella parasitica TaxID=35722 RepID=A0A0B7N197_9FUNG|nr:hypothetical protein [Parasitella parasitica]